MRTTKIVSLEDKRKEQSHDIFDQLLEQLDDIAAQVGKDEAISFLEAWSSEPSDRPETELDRMIKEMLNEQMPIFQEEVTLER